jgi:hypothetical protein
LKTPDDKIENVVNSSKMDIPMLEWIDEDSKAENFTLVLSKIKKKKKQTPMKVENLVKVEMLEGAKELLPK